MLTMLRNAARTWIAKALFVVLVASFAVWGVSGSMFTGQGDAVVTVGDAEVSPTEFRLAYERQIALLSQQFGTRITREQARAFGIENQVYAQLVAGATLDELASEMNLGLSQDRLANLIAQDPAFQGINGQFSRQNFAAALNSVGMSEEDYIRNQEQVAVRTQIVEALADGFAYPETMLDALSRHRAEIRTVDYVRVGEDDVPEIDEPSEEELATYFEERRDDYRAPEYRSIAYVTLTADQIADPETISDEAVRADYEANADRYASAERRTIDQLFFPDRDAAEEALAQLQSGTTFGELVEKSGRTTDDVRIGTFTREAMSSEALAEAAFAVEDEGGTTGIVEGPFGPVILRVAAIEEGGAQPFEEVADEIRRELALRDASDILFDVYNAYEDARAGGMSLREAARDQQLEPVVVEAVDRNGRTPEGEVLSDLPERRELLAAAFESDVGQDTAPISLGSEGYLWFEVLNVQEARDRELNEIRQDVVADWRAAQLRQAIAERAEELYARLEAGESLAQIAADIGADVQTEYSLQRSSENPVFGAAATAAAFAGPEGHTAVAQAEGGTDQLLMAVREIATAVGGGLPDAERRAIAESGGDDILDQLVVRLQSRYPVSINQQLGQQALSF